MRLKSAFILVLVSLIGSFVIACNSGSNNSGGGGNNGGGNNGGADGGGSGGGDSGGGEGDIVTGNTFNFGYIAYTVKPNSTNPDDISLSQGSPRGREYIFQIKNETAGVVNYTYSITPASGDEEYFEPAYIPVSSPVDIDPNSCIKDKVPSGNIKPLAKGESCNFLVMPRSVQSNDTKDDIDGKKSATLKILNDDKIVLEKKLESEYIWSANIDDMNIDDIYFHPSDIGVKSPSYFLFETNINQSRVEEMKTQGYELESATVEYTGDTAFQLDTEKTECGIKLANSKLPIEEYFCVVVFTFTPPDSDPKLGTFTEKIKYVNSSNGSEKGDTTTYTLNGEGLNPVN